MSDEQRSAAPQLPTNESADVAGMRGQATNAGTNAACSPLAQLNQYIRGARSARAGVAPLGETHAQEELASARRFRQAWDIIRGQDEVEQAVTRRPVNAGPLNSHALVLQSLSLMQKLSPDYLRRFLAHVEALQWLERASETYQHPPAGRTRPAKTTRRNRQKK